MDLQTWMCLWTGQFGGLGAALGSMGGHSRAGKGTSTGGFAELKERLKVRESKV